MTPENKAQVVAAAPSTLPPKIDLRAIHSTPFVRSALVVYANRPVDEAADAVVEAIAVRLGALSPTGGEAEQLQTDTQRMDWLEARRRRSRDKGFRWDSWEYDAHESSPTIREQIDAAMGVHLAASKSVRTSGEAMGTVPSAEESGQ